MTGDFRNRYFYTVIASHTILSLLWILFCFLHSLLAGLSLKRKVADRWPGIFKRYRLYYTVFAGISFLGILAYQLWLPSPLLFMSQGIVFWIGIFVLVAGAVIMGICIWKYFGRLSGLLTLFSNPTTSGNQLIITGIHRFVRHPLYLGTFLFIWGLFLVLPHWSLLLSNFIITVYTIWGIALEEQKLVEEFGDQYVRYRNTVPKLIPNRFSKAPGTDSPPKNGH